MPIHTPLPVPAHPDAPPPPSLSEKEHAGYDRVLARFADPAYVLPDVGSEEGALTEEERMWLSYECILRYLRATKHDVSESIRRLEGTLKWRRDFGLYTTVTAEYVEPEAVTGKEFIFGYDSRGRPAIYMCPSKQNAGESPRQFAFVFWFFERAIDLMGPGVETVTLMIDYADKGKNPSISLSRQVLDVLQTHYPERLGKCLVVHLPWILQAFWKIIMPLLDPVTRAKLVFNPVADENGLWTTAEARNQHQDGAKLFELEQLMSHSWLGSAEFIYEHDAYWPALLSMAEERRGAMTRVWRELGGTVGIKEWDVKVGVRDGATAPAADAIGQAS